MQISQIDRITDAMALAFSSCEFIERKVDGFQDYGTWSYVRPEEEEGGVVIEDDWLIGQYVAVVEDERENSPSKLCQKALTVVSKAGGEVSEIFRNADAVYESETDQKPTREMVVCKIVFTLRSPNDCQIC